MIKPLLPNSSSKMDLFFICYKNSLDLDFIYLSKSGKKILKKMKKIDIHLNIKLWMI